MEKILFKVLDDDVILPNYAYLEDAGMDIYSNEDKLLLPNNWALIKTGFSMLLPNGYEAQVRSKSGLALKSGIICLNSPGTIDCNYRGEVGVIVMNVSSVPYQIKKGQKIAQMVINKIEHLDCEVVEDLPASNRGEGGFGSTGIDNNRK